MKKTFLLALVLCLVSGFVFASVTTTLQLNLNDATSRLHAGFYDAAEITIGITPSTTSASPVALFINLPLIVYSLPTIMLL